MARSQIPAQFSLQPEFFEIAPVQENNVKCLLTTEHKMFQERPLPAVICKQHFILCPSEYGNLSDLLYRRYPFCCKHLCLQYSGIHGEKKSAFSNSVYLPGKSFRTCSYWIFNTSEGRKLDLLPIRLLENSLIW